MGNGSSATPGTLSKTSTADEVIATLGADKLHGKTVVITGANTGLGFETARAMVANGADVVLCSRGAENGAKAVQTIKDQFPNAKVTTEVLDLGSHASIRSFAKAYTESSRPINVLINNAGVMACPRTETSDGLEQQLGVNHVGHFLLTTSLLPVLEKSGSEKEPARVINVSSMGNGLFASPEGVNLDDFNAEKSYDQWVRYGESKLANILFTLELNNRMKEARKPVIAIAMHPGAILGTELARYMDFGTQLNMLGQILFDGQKRSTVLSTYYKSIPQGAATQTFASIYPNIDPSVYYVDCDEHWKSPEGILHPRAKDVDLARKLWTETEEVIAAIAAKQGADK